MVAEDLLSRCRKLVYLSLHTVCTDTMLFIIRYGKTGYAYTKQLLDILFSFLFIHREVLTSSFKYKSTIMAKKNNELTSLAVMAVIS